MATHREIIHIRVPDASCFRLVEAAQPRPADGQVLARTHFLSIDPYMRRQMGGGHGQYAKPPQPGDVMIGRGAGLVVDSRHPEFRSGERVQGEFGCANTRCSTAAPLMDWYRAGRLKFNETVAQGLEGPGGARQHAAGRQYRQAGGAPDRSHPMSPLRRGRFGRQATCKW
ncbi:MAG TPA: hypothetical protein VKD45_05325 [Hyphomicrobiaceae bacterium]|nr:hypothetical protein [Hyphomicrobiaceae bacterium]